MKAFRILLLAALCLGTPFQGQAAEGSEVPLYRVTVVQSSAKAISYRYLKSSTNIGFKGTVLQPKAEGSAKVKSKAGATEINARFEGLTPATQYGREYLTYVLWSISPEGRPNNLGELLLDKHGCGKLKATEPLQTFGLMVTAEPYFGVTQPSNVVVLENELKPNTEGKVEYIEARVELLQRGQYSSTVVQADQAPRVLDKNTPLAVYEARNAVRIAQEAGAETYADESYQKARQMLRQAESNKGSKKSRASAARTAVQMAEDARLVAVKRQEDLALDAERKRAQANVMAAETRAAVANQDRAEAEAAREQAELASLEANARSAAALQAANQAEAARANAERQAKKAEQDKLAMRTELQRQLNAIFDTRDSARGLIVNMPDSLFAFGKADLQPQVREKLAKISGIVMTHPGLKLEVEGYTDNVGSDESNQRLSERRAESARNYLISQGVRPDMIVSRGFGEASPIASNDTEAGRSKNRRVEIVVSGSIISTQLSLAER